MRILRINEGNSSDKEIIDWFSVNCMWINASNFYSHIEIKESGVHLKTDIVLSGMDDIPTFPIISTAGNIKIQNSYIESLEFLPKTIDGDFEVVNSDVKSLRGFPEKIRGGLHLQNCGQFDSFEGVNSQISGGIYIDEIIALRDLKAEGIKFRGNGVIIKNLRISSLKGLPVSNRMNFKDSAFFHISKTDIKNLIGLPPKVSNLYISDCPLESIEGIPFEVSDGFRRAVNISPKNKGNKEKVYSQIDLYYDMLERFQFKPHPASSPEENRASYIKWVLEKNPEYASLVPPNEIPKDLQGQKILKRLDLF